MSSSDVNCEEIFNKQSKGFLSDEDESFGSITFSVAGERKKMLRHKKLPTCLTWLMLLWLFLGYKEIQLGALKLVARDFKSFLVTAFLNEVVCFLKLDARRERLSMEVFTFLSFNSRERLFSRCLGEIIFLVENNFNFCRKNPLKTFLPPTSWTSFVFNGNCTALLPRLYLISDLIFTWAPNFLHAKYCCCFCRLLFIAEEIYEIIPKISTHGN